MVRGAEDFAASAFYGTPLDRADQIADGLVSLYGEAYAEFELHTSNASSAATAYVNDVFGDLELLDDGGVTGENLLDGAAGAYIIEHAADFGVTPDDKLLSVEDLQSYLGDDPVDTADEHFVQRIIADIQNGEFRDDDGDVVDEISLDDLKDYVLMNMVDPRIFNKKAEPIKTHGSNTASLPPDAPPESMFDLEGGDGPF